jgi:sulfite exporter TauE/SafE
VRRAVIQALACEFMVSREAIGIAHLVDFDRYFAAELRDLERLEQDGLVELDGEWIQVTPTGRLLVRRRLRRLRQVPAGDPGAGALLSGGLMEPLAAAAFVAGLLGGVHCAGMCGGVVGGLSASARGPALARHLAFNGGRIASYAAAGAAAGAVGGLGQLAGPVLFMQAAMFALANVLMLTLGLYVGGWGRGVARLERAGGVVWRRVEPYARRCFPIDTNAKALAAGLAWGWVPCGLVYTMLALAMASTSAWSGALVMAAFGLGTLPNLMAAGLAAQRVLAVRRSKWVRRGAGGALIALAVVGFARLPGIADTLHAGWAYCVAAI